MRHLFKTKQLSRSNVNQSMASSKKSIYSALGANLLIALTKFIAGYISNSASMIAEGIHSLVDTTNQLLLLLGIRRSKRAPDAAHPFGYGKELYFWSFIVSILIFGLGGGISIYQGIIHMANPEPLGDPTISYLVLAISVLFEGASLVVAAKAFNFTRGEMGWWAAAVTGLLIVASCIFLAHKLNLPILDGLASLLVGLLLVVVSALLARESRSLLMGEGIAPETKNSIVHIAGQHTSVEQVKQILSTYQSPDEVILMLILVFREQLTTAQINTAIDEIRERIREQFPLVKFIIIQPATL